MLPKATGVLDSPDADTDPATREASVSTNPPEPTLTRYRALFEHSRDAIVLSDHAGRIVDANPAMCELAGRPLGELLGLRSVDLAAPTESPHRIEQLRGRLHADGALRGVLPLLRSDGTIIEVEYQSVTRILDGLNLSIMRDVTEQRSIQRQLALSEQYFRALAEHAVEGIFRIQLQPERRFEYVNPAFRRITGFDLDDLHTDPLALRKRTHPDDVVGDDDTDARRLRYQRRDGAWRWLELRQAQIVDEHGAAVAVQGVVLDVTEQKRQTEALEAALEREHEAADELRRLDELKDGFLRAVSHELRTPLSAIYGFTKTLRERADVLEKDAILLLLDRVDANAERLRGLLDDLLDINRLTSSRLEPQREPVDLAELAQQVADDVPMGHRTLHLDLTPAPAMLEGRRIVRVVHNLLANAAKHTPAQTRVWMRTAANEDGSATLVVEDDGPGIPEELHASITDPFVQGPGAATSPSPGTGIGLSIVHQFTHMHGGTVEVGERPEGGARFRLTFPPHETEA